MYVDTHVADGSQVNNGSVISFSSAVAELSKKAFTLHHHSVTEMPIAALQETKSSLSLTEYSNSLGLLVGTVTICVECEQQENTQLANVLWLHSW